MVIRFFGHELYDYFCHLLHPTAYTLSFAPFFSAIRPEVQEWIGQEVRRVAGLKVPKDWDHITVSYIGKWTSYSDKNITPGAT